MCQECRPGECVDCPSADSPLEIDCPSCGAKGCDECEEGQMPISVCPFECVPLPIFRAMDVADLYEKGLPPVAGGSLDQTKWFTELFKFSTGEANRLEKQLGPKPPSP